MIDATTDDVWEQTYPGVKCPGMAEPKDGFCSSRLRDKRLRDLGVVRYCTKSSGYGTNHAGVGNCRWHLGNAKNHVAAANKEIVKREVTDLALRLGEELEPMQSPVLEYWRLSQKARVWHLAVEEKVTELKNWTHFDQAGIEHASAMVEMMERALDSSAKRLEFMMKHDLQRRVVALEEEQARIIGAAFYAIILDPRMKLSEAQIDLARHTMAVKFTELGAQLEPSWAAGIVDAEVVDE